MMYMYTFERVNLEQFRTLHSTENPFCLNLNEMCISLKLFNQIEHYWCVLF